MNQIMQYDPNALMQWGKMAHQSGLFKMQPIQAAMIIQAGAEIGYGPVQSLQNFYIVGNKVAPYGQTMGAMIKNSGKYDYIVKESSNEKAVIEFRQKFDEWESLGTVEFSMQDAAQAELAGMAWGKYPGNMLFWRCLAKGARMHCPDALMGMKYTPEELGDDLPEGVEVGVDEESGDQLILDNRAPKAVPESIPEPMQEDLDMQNDHLNSFSDSGSAWTNEPKGKSYDGPSKELIFMDSDSGEEIVISKQYPDPGTPLDDVLKENKTYITKWMAGELKKKKLAPHTAEVVKSVMEKEGE
tara:strand:- start:2068 stop:2964 length:897 start_codon:yes stop_codon:yes gene_type:complete